MKNDADQLRSAGEGGHQPVDDQGTEDREETSPTARQTALAERAGQQAQQQQ